MLINLQQQRLIRYRSGFTVVLDGIQEHHQAFNNNKKKTNVAPNWCIHSNKINVPGPTVRSLTIYVTDHFGTRSITEYPDYGLLLHSLDAESKSFAFVPQAFSLGQHESISMQWPIVSGLSVSNIGLAWVMWILSLCVCNVCVHLFIPTHNIFSFHSIPLRCVVSIPTISLLGNDSRRGALICTHYNVAAKMFSNMIIYGRLLSFRFWSRSCNIYECSVVSNFSFWLWLAVLRNRTLMSNARQQEVEDQKKKEKIFSYQMCICPFLLRQIWCSSPMSIAIVVTIVTLNSFDIGVVGSYVATQMLVDKRQVNSERTHTHI